MPDTPKPLLAPSASTMAEEKSSRRVYEWAFEAARDRFAKGLAEVFGQAFVGERFRQFALKGDPVYLALLNGMNDEDLARVFVGNWMVGQTLATQCRFWLEDVVVKILLDRNRTLDPALRPRVYTMSMLGDGWYESGKSVWDFGEEWREEIATRGTWEPFIGEKALDAINVQVGREEAQYHATSPAQRRAGACDLTEEADRLAMKEIAEALGGTARRTQVRCNLLFIEPEGTGPGPTIWGIRYINPSTFSSRGTIADERANLLRLRAFLAQEKPLRDSSKVVVAVADLVPRYEADQTAVRSRAHFSPFSRWEDEDLWNFLGVPFGAVRAGIREAGVSMEKTLKQELRKFLTLQQQ